MSLVDSTNIIDKFISAMEVWIGCKEYSDIHQLIIDLYNKGKDSGGYDMTLDDPWCAACIGAAATSVGITDIIPVECSCDSMIRKFQEKARFYNVILPYTPKRGDIVFYDWNNDGSADHVGVITSISSDNYLTVIEGNKSDTVGYRVIDYYSGLILGYGAPDYGVESTEPSTCESTPIIKSYTSYFKQMSYSDRNDIKKFPILRLGSEGVYVKILQIFLSAMNNADIEIDGYLGEKTHSELLSWQEIKNLEVDGECGKETWSSFVQNV